MPVCYSIDDTLDLVYLNPQGVATTHEFIECLEQYAEQAAFHSEIDVLIDLRDMAQYKMGEDETVAGLTRAIGRTREGSRAYRVAIIVRTEDQETIVSMSEGVLHRGKKSQAFYDLSEALHWLDRSGAEERVAGLRQTLQAENAFEESNRERVSQRTERS